MDASQIQPQTDYALNSPDTSEIRWPSPSPIETPEISNCEQLSIPDQELELIQTRPLPTSSPENGHCPACGRTGYLISQERQWTNSQFGLCHRPGLNAQVFSLPSSWPSAALVPWPASCSSPYRHCRPHGHVSMSHASTHWSFPSCPSSRPCKR
jgi:hypothetical protein